MSLLRTRGARSPAAWASLSLTLLAALAIALPATGTAASTVTWTASVGAGGANGKATMTAPATAGTAGTLKLALKGLSASTAYPVKIAKGTCAAPGSVLYTGPTQTSTSGGKIAKSLPIPAVKMNAIRLASSVVLRVGTGSKLRCGRFTGGPPPTATPARTPEPTSTPLPSPTLAAKIDGGPFLQGIAATPTAVWAGSAFYNALVHVDPTTSKFAGMVILGMMREAAPYAMDASADAVWVTSNTIEGSSDVPGKGSLRRVDPKTETVVATLDIGARPYGVAIGTSAVWASSAYTGLIYRVDPATNAVVTTIRPAVGPWGLAASGGSLWIADAGAKAVVRVDEATGNILATIPTVSYPWEVSVGAGAVWVVIGDPDVRGLDQLVRIDPATNTIVTSVKLDGEPWDVAASASAVWVASEGTKDAVWIDPATNTIGGRVPLGRQPSWVSVSGRTAWYVASESGQAQIIRVDY